MKYSFTTLTEDEKLLLRAFDKYGELLMPEWALSNILNKTQVYKLLNSLIKKNVVIKSKPYRLTKLGTLLKSMIP
jgi:predicted transcriptional regulator